ncbi:MAG: 1-acyl-sn-glycerol-3-phosphate acyltransferase [Clostridia bacterium]|nr:1-acyl-sn-glycerol-3-phosphate acyltransferase [Clostridia bacterium]
MTFFEKMYKMFQPAVFKLWRIQVSGEENIPEGGAIVASNHTAFSDVLVISASTKRQVRYMAKKELFKIPLLAQLIRGLGAYPVNRGGADVSSIKLTISMLEAGELIGIFPQGHRHGKKDPRTTEVKAGVGMIAYRSKAPIVPVFIDNARGKTGILRKNYVTFGKPIYFDELEFVSGGQTEYLNASKIIFRKVCEIKFGEGNGSLE